MRVYSVSPEGPNAFNLETETPIVIGLTSSESVSALLAKAQSSTISTGNAMFTQDLAFCGQLLVHSAHKGSKTAPAPSLAESVSDPPELLNQTGPAAPFTIPNIFKVPAVYL